MYQNNIYIKPEIKQRGKLKTSKILNQKISFDKKIERKPFWITTKKPINEHVLNLKKLIRKNKLHTVCEEASCPNLGECFSNGTATFMILGDICTRRCPFCDVAHGKPKKPDINEPDNLANIINEMELKYIVITSVDRDDLIDRGASHFLRCIQKIRQKCNETKIEILVPDFRSKVDSALGILEKSPPDVFNHNLESIPRLYKQIRPGANYHASLMLIKKFKERNKNVLTKSGLMVGLGEELNEVMQVLVDLKRHNCDMVTIGQYLQPSRYHLPVKRYVHPDEFKELANYAEKLGFINVASAPMVRSSYHADMQVFSI